LSPAGNFSSPPDNAKRGDTPYFARFATDDIFTKAHSPMSDTNRISYAPASAPDMAARLRHTMEANATTRIVLAEGINTLAAAINDHLDQIDQHLQELIDDLEGRAR
jgi:hypothetical protein